MSQASDLKARGEAPDAKAGPACDFAHSRQGMEMRQYQTGVTTRRDGTHGWKIVPRRRLPEAAQPVWNSSSARA